MAEGQLVDKELQESKRKIEQLEKEKEELAEKSKGLGEIIEQLSSDPKVDATAMEGMIGDKLKEMGEKVEAKIKKLEENSATGKDKEEVKKQVATLVKERVDPRLTEISDRLKELDKIKDIGEKVMQLNERLSSPLYQPKQPGAVSQGLASFGEQIDFESELNEVRKAVDSINQTLLTLSKKVEYRLSSAEDKLKELEKLKALEQMYREISDKLGAENIQKLKKVVFSADELTEEVVPEIVSRKIRKRIEPIVNSLKANRDLANELEKRISILDGDIRELKKFRDTINELRLEKDKLYKKFSEEEARFLQGLEILKMNIRKRMEKMMEKYQDQLVKMQQYTTPKVLEANVKDIVVSLFEQRFQEIEKQAMILDEKSKALAEKDRELGEMIEEMEAPENLRRWISEKTKDMERKFYYDIQGLKKGSDKNSDAITTVKEKQKTLESVINEISKKLTDQSATTNKVIDLRDIFAKRSESLTAGMKSLEQKIAADKERSIVLEQNLREMESRFDKLSENIAVLQKFVSEIKPVKEKLSLADASIKMLNRKVADKESLASQVKNMESEIASLKEKQSRLEAQAAADKVRFESSIKQSSLEKRHVEDGIKKERLKISELLKELKE